MNVFKTPDNTWRVRIRKKGHPAQTANFATEAEARAWAAEIEARYATGNRADKRKTEKTTLKELLQKFIDEYVPRYADADREKRRAKAIMEHDIATLFVAAIRPADVLNYIREREAEGANGSTIQRDLAILSRLCNVARGVWEYDALTSNPTANVPKPKIPPGRNRRLIGDEEQRLLEAASPKFRYVIKFALETAMRAGEISSLTWKDVNMDRRVATLQHTKNGEVRTVPLTPAAYRLLQELRDDRGSDSRTIFGMSVGAITQAMDDARRRSGIENLRFHDLRHEAISRLFENTDLDMMEIRAISGHKTLQMLARYTHLRTDRLVKRLEAAAEAASETEPKPKKQYEITNGGGIYIEKPATPEPQPALRKKRPFTLKSFLL